MRCVNTKGSTNIVADTLSRLETKPTNDSIAEAKNFVNIREANATLCGVEKHTDSVIDFASTTFPFTFSKIRNAQRSDAALLKLGTTAKRCLLIEELSWGRKALRIDCP